MVETRTKIDVKRDGYCLVRVQTEEKIQPVVCIADTHLGHKNFNEKKLQEVITWMKENNALWFGGGDLIENSNRNSVGSGWVEQVLSPQVQIDRVSELLSPIREQCLGLLNGNHEDRAYKDSGINPTQIIANSLGVPAAGDEIFIIVSNNRERDNRGRSYTIYGAHTKATNKTAGLAFNGMQNNMGWILTDVVCKAHGHDMGLSPPSIRVHVDVRNMAVVEQETYYWLVGHYLDRPDSYIAKRSGQPKPLGTEAIFLEMSISKPKRVTGMRL